MDGTIIDGWFLTSNDLKQCGKPKVHRKEYIGLWLRETCVDYNTLKVYSLRLKVTELLQSVCETTKCHQR